MTTMSAQRRRNEVKQKFDAFLAQCPSSKALDRISGKWVTLVVKALGDGPKRYSEISARLASVGQKMLTQTLRGLERDGLITRAVTPSVPVRADYELTPPGESLAVPLGYLEAWAEEHIAEIDPGA